MKHTSLTCKCLKPQNMHQEASCTSVHQTLHTAFTPFRTVNITPLYVNVNNSMG